MDIIENVNRLEDYLINESEISLNDIQKISTYLTNIREQAINYTRCCKSDSELLLCGVCDKETKHDTTLRDELHCLKCGNVAKE